MRLPAVRTLADRAVAAAARFPFVVADAAVAAVLAVILVDSGSNRDTQYALLAAILGLSLLTALTLMAERLGRSWKLRSGLPLGGVAILVGFFFLAKGAPDQLAWIRFFHWCLTFHLAVAVLPFAVVPESRGFWQLNRRFFERFLLAGLYTTVLFLGLALALGAVDRLLGIDVDPHTKPQHITVL
jgi:hypothetical protein